MGLRIAMNTFAPALDILMDRGFQVCCEAQKDHDFYNDWTAIKDDFMISAINSVELLGLAMIYKNYGKDWM